MAWLSQIVFAAVVVMRTSGGRAFFIIAMACLASLGGIAGAHAGQTRWPAATELPKPPPPATQPPAVLERPASVAAYAEANTRAGRTTCEKGKVCVVCVAACDSARPVVVQQMKPHPVGAIAAPDGRDNDADGIAANAPRFARQTWAGIECGSEGGCRGSGIPRASTGKSVDITITYFGPARPGGGTSHYIDR